MNRQRLLRHGAGLASMVVGSIAVLGGVVVMNELSGAPERRAESTATKIEVVKVSKSKPKPKQELRTPPPPPKSVAPPPPSLAALGGGLGGISMALPGLDLSGLSRNAGSLLGGGEDVVHTSETVDEAPRAASRPPLAYPARLREKGVEGYVLLSVLVDQNGAVEQAKVLESAPSGVFDDVAIEAIRGWNFAPGRYKGEAVKTWVRQRIAFELGS